MLSLCLLRRLLTLSLPCLAADDLRAGNDTSVELLNDQRHMHLHRRMVHQRSRDLRHFVLQCHRRAEYGPPGRKARRKSTGDRALADQLFTSVVARTNADICNTPRRSKKSDLIAVVLLCALAFFANILRLYSRWYLNSRFDTDDWIMLAVAVVLVPFQVCGEYGNFLAFGVDTWYIAPEDLTTGLQVRTSGASPAP